jgi:hypothetical protein
VKLKYPGIDVALTTAIWVFIVPLGIFVGVSQGNFPWYVIGAIFIGLAATGMWFQISTAGYAFGVANILLSIIGFVTMFMEDLSVKNYARLTFTAYSAYVAIAWSLKQEELIDEPYAWPDTVPKDRPCISAAKRGLLVGASVGVILGAITDSIILVHFLKSPSNAFGSDAPILVFVIFGIGPVVVGGLICSVGFAVAKAIQVRFTTN